MVLNWTPITISDIIATSVLFVMFFITIYFYQKEHYPHLIYLSLIWLTAAHGNLFFNLANLFALIKFNLAVRFYIGFFICMPIQLLFCIFFVDFITRESVDPLKLAIWGIMTGMLIIVLFMVSENLFYINEVLPGIFEITFIEGLLNPIFIIISIYWAVLFILLGIRILIEVPKNLRFISIISFIGICLIIIRAIFSLQFNAISPVINLFLLILGFGSMFFSFIKYPALAFVIPFKVLRLNVLDIQSGITIYTHDFYPSNKMNLINEVLFSGMIQGINSILQEAVNKGDVHEIHMDKAVLLLKHFPESPVLFGLVVTKASRMLRKAMELFASSFIERFTKKIGQLKDQMIDLEYFRTACDFIPSCFPFVPEYSD